MTYVIDRIENGVAVLECMATGEVIEISQRSLPKTAREGYILHKDGDTFTIDREATQKRRGQLQERLKRILNRSRR